MTVKDPINFDGNAAFISRYKGDTFKGTNSQLKSELFDLILTTDIRSKSAFKSLLSLKGEVSIGKAGKADEYLKFRPHGQSRNIRLKEACFKDRFLEHREISREKPSDKEVYQLLDDWVSTVSHENKHIYKASPKTRKEYYSLSIKDREEFLNEQRQQYSDRYLSQGGRTADHKSGTQRIGNRRFAEIPNGLPSLPERSVVLSHGTRPAATKSILSGDEKRDLVATGTRGNRELRRSAIGRGRRSITSYSGFDIKVKLKPDKPQSTDPEKPQTVAESLLVDHIEQSTKERELQFYRVLRRNLKGRSLLDNLAQSHGIDPDSYQIFRAKDGSQRIRTGKVAFNVSDFCTKYMQLSWGETKDILTDSYQSQKTQQQQQQIVNSISFVSRGITQGYQSNSKRSILATTLRNYRYLSRKEQQGANDMYKELNEQFRKVIPSRSDKDNTIEAGNKSLSMVDHVDMLKRSRELSQQLSSKWEDIVAKKDLKGDKVEFRNLDNGKVAFTDTGGLLTFKDKQPDIRHVGAAMELAEANNYGVLKITGTREFKQQVLEVAVAKDMRIVFDDKQMQADFLKAKELKAQSLADTNNTIADAAQMQQSQDKAATSAQENSSVQTKELEPNRGVIVEHGEANYQFDADATKSYYIKLDNGETKWGVGLKYVIEKTGADVGDEIRLDVASRAPVTVTEKIKDENGQVVEVASKAATRNEWELEIVNKANLEVDNGNVTYKWDDANKKLDVLVDGKHPSALDNNALASLKDNNSFLQHYPIEDLKSGKLDLAKAPDSEQIPIVYDEKGELVTKSTVEKPEAPQADKQAKESNLQENYAVTYKFNEATQSLDVKINGKHPNNFDETLLDNIKGNDEFLKNYNREEIQTGALDISKTNAQPQNNIFDNRGAIVTAQAAKVGGT